LEYLKKAFQAVERNVFSLGLYLVIVVGARTAGTALRSALGLSEESARGNPFLFFCAAGTDAFLAAACAAAQTVVFSRFAKDMDRPLWRMRDDREALRRYFLLWLILNGIIYLLFLLSSDLPLLLDNEDAGAIPRWLLLFALAVYIPLGAGMMFQQTTDWRKMTEGLAPYGRQFGKILLVCCFSAILFLLHLTLLIEGLASQPLLRVAVEVILCYFDCAIFCAAWVICMHDRQNPEDSSFEF
jgi:hypothetical protein